MELIKKNIHMNKLKCKTSLQLTLDDDFNVSDVKPDIAKIIKEQGTVKIHDVKIQNNKLMVKGSLHFNVLYLSDESSRPVHNISGEIPFDEMIHLEDSCMGGEAYVTNELEDLSTSLINSRKLNVQSIIRLHAVIEELCDEPTAISVSGDSDVEFIQKTITVTDIAVDKKDIFRIKEQNQLPSTKGNVSDILYSNIELRNPEARLLDNKFSIKGEIIVFVLYSSEDEDNPVEFYETEIPFSGIIECNGCNENMIDNIMFSLGSKSIEVMPDTDGEERILDVEAMIELGIKIYGEETLDLLHDVYSPVRELTPLVNNAHYENLLIKNNSKIRLNDRVRVDASSPGILQICHASGDIKIDDIELVDGGIEVSGVLDVQILYICGDDKNPINSIKGITPFNQLIEVKGIQKSSIYQIKPGLEQLSVMMLDSQEIEVKASVGLNTIVFDSLTEPVITDIEVRNIDYNKIRSMPSIVGYVVKNTDSLWNIAKKYYTTVDRLKELNGLESDAIKPGDKLVIMKKVDKLI